jgi:DNA-binding MarR family transcriptional regulator
MILLSSGNCLNSARVPKTHEQLLLAAELGRAAEFRSALRRFLRRTEEVCSSFGLTPQRYNLLLMIKAAPDGTEESTVTELSDRLALAQPAVTELVKRAERAALVERRQDSLDGRVYRLRLTGEGERQLLNAFSALTAERESLLAAFRHADARLRALSRSIEPHEPPER